MDKINAAKKLFKNRKREKMSIDKDETPTTWSVDYVAALDEDYQPAPKAKQSKPKTHVMADGENILTVAQAYLPSSMTRKEYAKDLASRNSNWSTGATIQL